MAQGGSGMTIKHVKKDQWDEYLHKYSSNIPPFSTVNKENEVGRSLHAGEGNAFGKSGLSNLSGVEDGARLLSRYGHASPGVTQPPGPPHSAAQDVKFTVPIIPAPRNLAHRYFLSPPTSPSKSSCITSSHKTETVSHAKPCSDSPLYSSTLSSYSPEPLRTSLQQSSSSITEATSEKTLVSSSSELMQDRLSSATFSVASTFIGSSQNDNVVSSGEKPVLNSRNLHLDCSSSVVSDPQSCKPVPPKRYKRVFPPKANLKLFSKELGKRSDTDNVSISKNGRSDEKIARPETNFVVPDSKLYENVSDSKCHDSVLKEIIDKSGRSRSTASLLQTAHNSKLCSSVSQPNRFVVKVERHEGDICISDCKSDEPPEVSRHHLWKLNNQPLSNSVQCETKIMSPPALKIENQETLKTLNKNTSNLDRNDNLKSKAQSRMTLLLSLPTFRKKLANTLHVDPESNQFDDIISHKLTVNLKELDQSLASKDLADLRHSTSDLSFRDESYTGKSVVKQVSAEVEDSSIQQRYSRQNNRNTTFVSRSASFCSARPLVPQRTKPVNSSERHLTDKVHIPTFQEFKALKKSSCPNSFPSGGLLVMGGCAPNSATVEEEESDSTDTEVCDSDESDAKSGSTIIENSCMDLNEKEQQKVSNRELQNAVCYDSKTSKKSSNVSDWISHSTSVHSLDSEHESIAQPTAFTRLQELRNKSLGNAHVTLRDLKISSSNPSFINITVDKPVGVRRSWTASDFYSEFSHKLQGTGIQEEDEEDEEAEDDGIELDLDTEGLESVLLRPYTPTIPSHQEERLQKVASRRFLSAEPSLPPTRTQRHSTTDGGTETGSVMRSVSDISSLWGEECRKKEVMECRNKPYKSDPFHEGDRNSGDPASSRSSVEQHINNLFQNVKATSILQRVDSGVGSDSKFSSPAVCNNSALFLPGEVVGKPPIESADSLLDDIVAPPAEFGDDSPLDETNTRHQRERTAIIQELVDTEKNYCIDLKTLQNEFMQPMMMGGLLTPEQLDTIFHNIEELISVSEKLYQQLQDSVSGARISGDEDLLSVEVGCHFLDQSLMFVAYERYCINQSASSALLEQLLGERELLRVFLQVCQQEKEELRKMDIKAFLMLPVQRIMKYPLLLKRLLKVTPKLHPDHNSLPKAQHKVEAMLTIMNAKSTGSMRSLKRFSSVRRSNNSLDSLQNLFQQQHKVALEAVPWDRKDSSVVRAGPAVMALLTDNMWEKKSNSLKFQSCSLVLVAHGKCSVMKSTSATTPSLTNTASLKKAALVFLKEKGGKFFVFKEPLLLGQCVVTEIATGTDMFELHEAGKDSFIIRAESLEDTEVWCHLLRAMTCHLATWHRRRLALANIMLQ